VKITHKYKEHTVSKDGEDVTFLMTNRLGGYVSFSDTPISRYQGVYYQRKGTMLKVVENITLATEEPAKEIENQFSFVRRKRKNHVEKIILPIGHDCVIYELENPAEFFVDLDIRESYDSREWGREFEVSRENDYIVVKYTKDFTEIEDKKTGREYQFFVVIKTDSEDIQEIKEWRRNAYSYDEKRGSHPACRYIFRALKINGKKAVIAYDYNKDVAVRRALEAYKDERVLAEMNTKNIHAALDTDVKASDEVLMAYRCASNSLNSLIVNDGIQAGLYFFFQVWARDEAIAVGGLISQGKYHEAKKILLRQLKLIQYDGRIPNRDPPTRLGSADAIGWVCKRLLDLFMILKAENKLQDYFDHKEIKMLQKDINTVVERLIRFHTTEEFLDKNRPQETWMDTVFKEDTREGSRIEQQALRLKIFRLLEILSRITHAFSAFNDSQKHLEYMKNQVKTLFFNGKLLADGLNDYTIRPNIFLACYIFPELLDRDEWISVIESSLPKLWLEWGGVATIDKNNPLYVDEHTGENDRSYHRGDSWFFVNNIAGIVMSKLDYGRFQPYITKILEASTSEILWKNAVGHASEISSAKQLAPFGCFAQAWSNSTYIELVSELSSKR